MARLRFETAPEVTVNDESTVFKAASGATAPLVEFKNSAGTVVADVAANGTVTVTSISGATKTMVGLGNVDNTSDANKPVSTAGQTALDLKANLASPSLTGVPLSPTASAGTSTSQIATTEFVSNAVANLVDVAPAALNTLNELAAALGDDANFATTTATNLGLKANIASPTFTGVVTVPAPTNGTDAATKQYVDSVSSDLSSHNSDTTNVHGITDTTILVTTTGAQTLTNKTITSPSGLVKGDVGLGGVDNTADTAKPVSTAQQTALDLKANLASPTFTGTPTLPTGTIATTQAAGDSNTKVATTAFVTAAISDLSASSASTYIDESIFDAKGDLIVASAADTVGRLAVGTNGQFLKANSSSSTGLEWAAVPTINTLDDVGDVTITSAASGQFLKWNGSAWVNDSVPVINSIDDITGVTLTSVAANQVLFYDGTAWVNTSNPTVGGNLAVTGNLTVSGTTTTVNSETLTIDDNIIVLNNNASGAPTENAGVEIERGSSTNVVLRWNETTDCWEFTNDGTNYQRIITDTVTNAQTASYTLVSADSGKMVEMSVATANILTVPPNSSVAFPVGTTLTVLQTAAGQCTLTAGSGVTVNATPGLKLRTQWSSATLIKRATDTWVALGDLAA